MDSTIQLPTNTDSLADVTKFADAQYKTYIPHFKEPYSNMMQDIAEHCSHSDYYFSMYEHVNETSLKDDIARGLVEQYTQYRNSIKNALCDTYEKMIQENKELFDTLDEYIEKISTASSGDKYNSTYGNRWALDRDSNGRESVINLENDRFYNDVIKLDELFQEAVTVAKKYFGTNNSSGF